MAFVIQDFDKGVDLTGVNPISAAQLNQLIDGGVPHAMRGLTLYSIDSALNTPDVPNPLAGATYTKFKRYIWIRKPYNTATSTQPIAYVWDDDAVSDATLLKWKDLAIDLTAFIAEIDAAVVVANAANATANAANVAAANAAVLANTATNNATAALTAANNASAAATVANANAGAAQSTATSAAADAAAALVAVSAKKDVNAAINPGGIGRQLIRTNLAADGVEWFNPKDLYIQAFEQQATTVNGGAASNGANVRVINNLAYNTGGLASLAGNKITLIVPGTYRIAIRCPYVTTKPNQAFLIKDSDGSVLLQGSSQDFIGGGGYQGNSFVVGCITVVANTVVRVDHYFLGADVAAYALGKSSGTGPVGQVEIYTMFEATLLQ